MADLPSTNKITDGSVLSSAPHVNYEAIAASVPLLKPRILEAVGLDTRYHEREESVSPFGKSRQANIFSPNATARIGGSTTLPILCKTGVAPTRIKIPVTAVFTIPEMMAAGYEDGAVTLTVFGQQQPPTCLPHVAQTPAFGMSCPVAMESTTHTWTPSEVGRRQLASSTDINSIEKEPLKDPIVSCHIVRLNADNVMMAVAYQDAVYVHAVHVKPTGTSFRCAHPLSLRIIEVSEGLLRSSLTTVQLAQPSISSHAGQAPIAAAGSTVPLRLSSVRLSPCRRFLAVGVAPTTPTVLVFSLPDGMTTAPARPRSGSRVSLQSATLREASGPPTVPALFFTFCTFQPPEHSFNWIPPAVEAPPSTLKGRSAVHREVQAPSPAPTSSVRIQMYFLTGYSEAMTKALTSTRSLLTAPMPTSVALLVVWEESLCYTRIPLRVAPASFATQRQQQEASRTPSPTKSTKRRPSAAKASKKESPRRQRRPSGVGSVSETPPAQPTAEVPESHKPIMYSASVILTSTCTADHRYVVLGCSGGAVMLLDQHRCLDVASVVEPRTVRHTIDLQALVNAVSASTVYGEDGLSAEAVSISAAVRYGDQSHSIAGILLPLRSTEAPRHNFLSGLPSRVMAMGMTASLTVVFLDGLDQQPTFPGLQGSPSASLSPSPSSAPAALLWDNVHHTVLGALPLRYSALDTSNVALVAGGADTLTWVQHVTPNEHPGGSTTPAPTLVPCHLPASALLQSVPSQSLSPALSSPPSATDLRQLHETLPPSAQQSTAITRKVKGTTPRLRWMTKDTKVPGPSYRSARYPCGSTASQACPVLSHPPTLAGSDVTVFPSLWLSALEASADSLRRGKLNHILATFS